MRSLSLILPAALTLLTAISVHAAGGGGEAADVETKLREALRDTMLKLRDAQAQVANAQAETIAAQTKIDDLTRKNEALGKELVAERNVSANMISELTTKIEERGTIITQLQASIEKWKQSYAGATSLAAKKESERAKLEARALKLERLVQDQQVKNIEMYKAGMATLDRYEKFGLGDALLAREPFVGTTRIKFKNAIQEQADKLADARIQPPADPANPATAPSQPETQKATPPEQAADSAPQEQRKPVATSESGARATPFARGNPESDSKPAKPSKPQA